MSAMRSLILAAVLGTLAGCVSHAHRPGALGSRDCAIVVYDLTPHSLEIRLGGGASASAPIGALNPGELLNYSLPCSSSGVWVTGTPIPPQVGARTSFQSVGGYAALVPGTRTEVALQWP